MCGIFLFGQSYWLLKLLMTDIYSFYAVLLGSHQFFHSSLIFNHFQCDFSKPVSICVGPHSSVAGPPVSRVAPWSRCPRTPHAVVGAVGSLSPPGSSLPVSILSLPTQPPWVLSIALDISGFLHTFPQDHPFYKDAQGQEPARSLLRRC